MPTPPNLRLLDLNVLRPSKTRSADDIAAEITMWIERYDPDVLALQEVSALHVVLNKIPGYKYLRYSDRSGGDNSFLVREGLGHGAGWDIEVDEAGGFYWSAKGGKVWGRSHVTVKVEWCRFTNVHFPPAINFLKGAVIGPVIRAGVYALQLRQLDKHVKAFWKVDPAHVAVGDWNERDTDNGLVSPGGWARRAGLTLLGGERIDWATGRGVTAKLVAVVLRDTEGNKSDHPVVVWDLTPAFVTTPAPATPKPEPVPAPTPTPVPVPTPTPAPTTPEVPVARQARSLDVLLAEVNTHAPKRNKASDGGKGDPAHASRVSDHNPNRAGVWRARDFTNDPNGGFQADLFANLVARKLGVHPALGSGAYIIWNRRIISTDRLREGWRPYGGANGHTKHVHVSVGTSGYDSTAPWNVFAPAKVYQPGQRDLSFREGRDPLSGPDVRFVQKKIGMGVQDGYFGPKTAAAVKAWETQHNNQKKKPLLKADGFVGLGTWVALGIFPEYGAKK